MSLLEKFCLVVDFAGQEALAKRTERHKTDPQFLEGGQDVRFDIAEPQRIFALQRGDRLYGVGAADGFGARLRQAEMLDLALGDQLLDRSGHLLDWKFGVGAVLIEQIDRFQAQPFQRAVDGLADLGRANCWGRYSPAGRPGRDRSRTWLR